MTLLTYEDALLAETEGECTGECCRLITLSLPPDRIAQIAASNRRYRKELDEHILKYGNDRHFQASCGPGNYDAVFVEENFVPVRRSWVHADTGDRVKGKEPEQQYRCIKWDGKRCTAYEDRPKLCRVYGINNKCTKPGCTFRYKQDEVAGKEIEVPIEAD